MVPDIIYFKKYDYLFINNYTKKYELFLDNFIAKKEYNWANYHKPGGEIGYIKFNKDKKIPLPIEYLLLGVLLNEKSIRIHLYK